MHSDISLRDLKDLFQAMPDEFSELDEFFPDQPKMLNRIRVLAISRILGNALNHAKSLSKNLRINSVPQDNKSLRMVTLDALEKIDIFLEVLDDALKEQRHF